MKKFIRLDMKGHWRGREHISSVQGMGEEYGTWEKGISCYCLDDQAYALDSLREYWFETASIREKDLENMQVTIRGKRTNAIHKRIMGIKRMGGGIDRRRI